MDSDTVNRFRARRGRVLAAQIRDLAGVLGRPVSVLDVGGRAAYWANVGFASIAAIRVMNLEATELGPPPPGAPEGIFSTALGDARDLSDHADGSVDLVHANSVIEHVGAWPDMAAMASEMRRVGRAGWVQTPAWEFPVEPHYRAPFLHWAGQPLRRRMLGLSRRYRAMGVAERRGHIDRINLLSRIEMAALFPDCDIWTERVALLPKSHVARWMPPA